MDNKIEHLLENINREKDTDPIDTPVVIMAGGMGTRLNPLTKILPKPLIPIEDIPIVERIIDNFYSFGCKNFYLTINYKRDIIINYFINKDIEYDVQFVVESKPLGTAGSLFLIKDKIEEDFFLSNCDILINGDYSDMLAHHKKQNNEITCIASKTKITVPYGIFEIDNDNQIIDLIEKPNFLYVVNTGMYIISPTVLDLVPENESFDITDLIELLIDMDRRVGIYTIDEDDWLDMGNYEGMLNMLKRLGTK